jgi:Protein of unknown function (DUF4242)
MAQVVVVEQVFDPPLTDEEHGRIGKRIDECAEKRKARWLRSYLSADRKRMVCEFESPDVQSVRDVYRTAGVTVERVWGAELYKRE